MDDQCYRTAFRQCKFNQLLMNMVSFPWILQTHSFFNGCTISWRWSEGARQFFRIQTLYSPPIGCSSILLRANKILFSSSDVAAFFVLLVDTAISLPSSFVGASVMLCVEPFLKENLVVWSILLPLNTIDTHF